MERFANNQNFYSIDFLQIFEKRRKLVEKITHRKKNGVTQRPRSLNPRKVVTMVICSIIIKNTISSIVIGLKNSYLFFSLVKLLSDSLLSDIWVI